MRKLIVLFCLLLGIQLANSRPVNTEAVNTVDDPIALCRQIINDHPEPWTLSVRSTVIDTFGDNYPIKTGEDKYILFESPGLAFDYFQGGFSDVGQAISKKELVNLLRQAINAPQIATLTLAKASIQQGLEEYLGAFEIARKIRESKEVSYEEAIRFLDNRFGYKKLDLAKELIALQEAAGSAPTNHKNIKKALAKVDKIENRYPSQIPLVNALPLFEEVYQLLKSENIGIAGYAPYRSFNKQVHSLNQSRINERIKFRSSIRITSPNARTTWTIPDPVEIKWTTNNIDPDKTIRFFLVKDEMVVQDLGTFKNSQLQEGIILRKSLPAGDRYKVMGIEQFPVNKYHVAKFATPFFSITKRRPPKKEETPPTPVVEETPPPAPPPPPAVEEPAPPVVAEIVKEELPEPPVEEEIVPEPIQPDVKKEEPKEEEIAMRDFFDGRSISYIKELVVENPDITISLWDHGRQDGDIVSIYLNGEAVVSKHTLTYKKKQYEITLDTSKPNDLFLYAHNLGRFAPNTVSMEIRDGQMAENIILNSDLKSCEAILINVKQ